MKLCCRASWPAQAASGLLVRMRDQCSGQRLFDRRFRKLGGFGQPQRAQLLHHLDSLFARCHNVTAISRTLVAGTWLKMLRYQCTMGSLKKYPTPDSILVNNSRLRGRGRASARGAGPLEFCITGSLRQLGPDEHVLAQIDRVLDLVAAGRNLRSLLPERWSARDRSGGGGTAYARRSAHRDRARPQADALILPTCNAEAMNLHLGRSPPPSRPAGWHLSTVVSTIFRTFDQATASVCTTCG